MRRTGLIALLCTVWLGLGLQGNAQELKAATMKKINVKNPSADAVGMTVSNNLEVLSTTGTAGKSNTFKTGPITNDDKAGTGTVAFSDGTLKQGATDGYTAFFKGAILPPIPPATFFISKVEFNHADGTVTSLINTTGIKNPSDVQKAQAKAFATNVTGFTYDEFWNLQDLLNASLHIGNPNSALDLQYTIFNLNVYTNLPLANFDSSSFTNVGSVTPVFTTPEVVLGPGATLDASIGSVMADAYELATATEIQVEDLDTDSISDFAVPQAFAEALETVPEPTSGALLGVSVLLLGLLAPLRGRAKPRRVRFPFSELHRGLRTVQRGTSGSLPK